MRKIEFERERRRQLAFERLGSNIPTCVGCAESDWRCLELHCDNLADADSTTLVICRKCKAKQSNSRPNHRPKWHFCVICADCDPRCLEDHHVAGRKYDSITVVVCFNCHRKLTDMQKGHPQ
jgi:hypothetical protein